MAISKSVRSVSRSRRSRVASPSASSALPAVRLASPAEPPAEARLSRHHDVFDAKSAPTLIDAVWSSIATPGAGPGLVAAVNMSLALFLVAMCYFASEGMEVGHLAVLGFLAVGLLISFNWFLILYEASKSHK